MVSVAAGSMPIDIATLINSYQSNRIFVDLPQGGLANPMAVSYNPADMYRLLRAVPSEGYLDSESVNQSAPGMCLNFRALFHFPKTQELSSLQAHLYTSACFTLEFVLS